ncbi:hypothetical protein AGMMS50249_1330 [candidate division SR1 bacterium]|nr:hypothetical protein AGMMS50249_1330 [candidate division SR1 bacterium]
MKKSAFTFIEMVLVMSVLAILLPLIFSTITKATRIKEEITVQTELYQQTYEVFERLNNLTQDYTIDYEEYFNRQKVGCNGVGGSSFSWNVVNSSGYCQNFTAYGNEHSFSDWDSSNDLPDYHKYYYCSDYQFSPIPSNERVEDHCFSGIETIQSYGQYSKLFYDMHEDTDGDGSSVGDTDDEDLGVGPVAIANATGVQELYLISKNGDERLYLRRKLVSQYDIDNDGYLTGDGEQLFVIQMLKLRGFDAGEKHNYDDTTFANNPGVFDGQIDTWACDASQGFVGHGASIGGAYSSYRLPSSAEDCWVVMYQGMLTFTDWNLTIYPDKDPNLAYKEDAVQINPYVKIFVHTRPYLPDWQLNIKSYLRNFHIAVETMFNIQSNYEG